MLVNECLSNVTKGILTIENIRIPPRRVIAAKTAYTIEKMPK
jgi:hypothetical protein